MGYTLAQLRVGKHWTQEQAATAVGVSPASWAKWENKRSSPTQKNVDKILEAFNVAYDDIIF